MPKPPNSQWNKWAPGSAQAWMRGPNEPTAYELAVKQFGFDSLKLKAWVRRWYLSKYVPEDILADMRLEHPWYR
jgi:hypothetical protein